MSPRVHFAGTPYDLLPEETLLDGLARQGVKIPSFCRTGACQTCLVRATSGSPPRESLVGVADALVQRGCFLACQCVPEGPLEVEFSDAIGTFTTRVARVEGLSAQVMRVELEVPEGFEYRAGQFVQLEREGGVTRPYSMASIPGSSRLEFHVQVHSGGVMSQWLRWAEKQPITLRGPFGECFYFETEPERPLLLAGTGTGLAPLLGVTRAALAAGHRGPIHLYHGSSTREGLYLFEALRALAASAPQLRVFGSVLEAASGGGATQQRGAEKAADESRVELHHVPLDKLILADTLDFFQCRVYLCGDPELVQRLRKRIYLSGAPQGRIHCDPFVAPPS
ncbi:MAG TPA: 2Fe-2S iron-sulfur cluster-binding protein [Polyangiaceae bacterium]|nr:2Fe-2S iron-sulfur cluster-binding protein [Polyangiaceae bacterium]